MDIFIAALDAAAGDSATYLGIIPRDIIGIIREMYPETYSSRYMFGILREMYDDRIRKYYGNVLYANHREPPEDINEEYLEVLLRAEHRREFLRLEAASKNKLLWWASILINIDTDSKVTDDCEAIFSEMYGDTELECQLDWLRFGDKYIYNIHPEFSLGDLPNYRWSRKVGLFCDDPAIWLE